tara:strand:+ start:503 stop:721 length:219 start_codon:yes stop_codon:yes gene_type:complete
LAPFTLVLATCARIVLTLLLAALQLLGASFADRSAFVLVELAVLVRVERSQSLGHGAPAAVVVLGASVLGVR